MHKTAPTNGLLKPALRRWHIGLSGAVAALCWLVAPPAIAQPAPAPAKASAPTKAKPAAGPTRARQTPARPSEPPRAYKLAAAPAWVAAVTTPVDVPAEFTPTYFRLVDEQTRVTDRGADEYARSVQVVRDASGLGNASQWQASFDPSYQTMTLHHVDVLREGRRQARLPAQRIEVLQRESQLEQSIYDGRLTVSIVLDDIRVGDEIDIAFTISGANPVFEGRFVQTSWMGGGGSPVMLRHSRLLAPVARTIHVRAPREAEVSTRELGGERETRWVRRDLRSERSEPGTPWAALTPQLLQLSEFADWNEVAAWGSRLFADAGPQPQVDELAAQIRAGFATPQARAAEALRVVQREVRYFGVSMGPNSHRPHPPERVLAQRFGDCKDKVALLGALLSRLEVPARPVLVSQRLRDRVEELLPSPLAFDHAITVLELDGRRLVLDPTRSHQSGPLAAREARFGRGLELTPGTGALAALPRALDRRVLEVDDQFTVKDFSAEAELVSRITWHGELAEGVRQSIADRGVEQLADAVNVHYVRAHPQIRRLAVPQIENSTESDAVTLVQRFALPGLWRYMERRTLRAEALLWAGLEALRPPSIEARSTPWAFDAPGEYRHRVRMDFAEPIFRDPANRRFEERDAHFGLDLELDAGRQHVEYLATVRHERDRVEPGAWMAYQAALQRSFPRLGAVFAVPVLPLARIDTLQEELQALDDKLRGRRPPAVTVVQARALADELVLSAQLESGRLNGAARAEALLARGIARDHLGRLDEAQADHEAALALAPDSLEAQRALAVNAQGRGDLERVLALTDQLLTREEGDIAALATRGRGLYLAGRLDESRQAFEKILSRSQGVRSGFPLIWLSLVHQRQGRDLAELRARYPESDWPRDWPRPLLDVFLAGGEARTALAAAGNQRSPASARTEALFFLAERDAAGGDTRGARRGWQQVVDLGVTEYVEHQAARLRLAAPQR